MTASIKLRRVAEMRQLVTVQYMRGVMSFLGLIGPILVTATTFATYSKLSNNRLDAATAFAALAWFNMLVKPVAMLPLTINSG